MGVVSGGGGGAAFNGGTITHKLAVATTDNTAEPLIAATAPAGFNNNANPPDLLRLIDEDGTVVLSVEDGGVAVQSGPLGGQALLSVVDTPHPTSGVYLASLNGISVRGDSASLTVQDASSVVHFQVAPTGAVLATGTVTAAGAQLNPITSGALTTTTFSSGVGKQLFTTRDVILVVPFTGDATNNAATLLIQLSPDNVTYSTLDTLSIAAALNLTGALNVPTTLQVPSGWWVKLTATHGTIGTATVY